MRLITYQSEIVLKILKQGKVYTAKPSISFKKEYEALVEMADLKCQCPIFAVVKGKKQNTSGRVSGAIRFELEVPKDKIKYTEFSVWADFMDTTRYTRGNNYKKLYFHGISEVTQDTVDNLIEELSTQKPLNTYQYPQALLEEIKPEWIVSYKKMPKRKGAIDFGEKIINLFKK